MGCDIHLYTETKVDDKWIANEKFHVEEEGTEDEYFECTNGIYVNRDYNLFGILAGVRRGDVPQYPIRGLPKDCSDEIQRLSDQWDCDGHTHSWVSLYELKKGRDQLKNMKIPVGGMMLLDQKENLICAIERNDPNWMKYLYPYCQWTNDNRQVNFVIQANAYEMIGDGLDEIIKGVEKSPNEGDKRIVFFFDN